MSTGDASNEMSRGHYTNHQPQQKTSGPSVFTMPLPSTLPNAAAGSVADVAATVGGVHHHHHHQQYPGITSIPGMHSMGQMSNVHGFSQSFSGLPAINNIAPPILPPPNDNVGNTVSVPSHSISNHHFSTGLLSGAVDKRRKPRNKGRATSLTGVVGSAGEFASKEEATIVMSSGSAPPGSAPPHQVHQTHPVHQTHRAHRVHQPISPHHAISPLIDAGGESQTANVTDATTSVTLLPPPTPLYELDGIQFKVLEQLPDTKIQRLRSEKIKPIELLTFDDIKAYNRNQLRAYCSVYGIRRKKKSEMEKDMARYAAMFHPNDSLYDLSKFEPTEYADGPIPRRKIPVTKEQKEQAAGDFNQLTNALLQRPSFSAAPQRYSAVNANTSGYYRHGQSHGGSGNGGGCGAASYHQAQPGRSHAGHPHMQPPPQHGGETATTTMHNSLMAPPPPRLHDMHGGGSPANPNHGQHAQQHQPLHHHTTHAFAPSPLGHHVSGSLQQTQDEGEHTNTASPAELMAVPDMHVNHHLLSLSHQMGDE